MEDESNHLFCSMNSTRKTRIVKLFALVVNADRFLNGIQLIFSCSQDCLVMEDSFDPGDVSMWAVVGGATLPDVRCLCDRNALSLFLASCVCNIRL